VISLESPSRLRVTLWLATAAASGALIMALEILSFRLYAPYLGNSIYVWGTMISVVMLALAAGYAVGGWVADRSHTDLPLSHIGEQMPRPWVTPTPPAVPTLRMRGHPHPHGVAPPMQQTASGAGHSDGALARCHTCGPGATSRVGREALWKGRSPDSAS
jgi:hypothetical protein